MKITLKFKRTAQDIQNQDLRSRRCCWRYNAQQIVLQIITIQTNAQFQYYVFHSLLAPTYFGLTATVRILGKWPTRRKNFYASIFIFNSLHVSNTSCSSSGETKCVNTTSGNCYSVFVVVSCAGWDTRHDHQHRVTVTRDCIETICLSWWWARCVRNM
jgi:hypothetical protein